MSRTEGTFVCYSFIEQHEKLATVLLYTITFDENQAAMLNFCLGDFYVFVFLLLYFFDVYFKLNILKKKA